MIDLATPSLPVEYIGYTAINHFNSTALAEYITDFSELNRLLFAG